jgi:hypothetical protein
MSPNKVFQPTSLALRASAAAEHRRWAAPKRTSKWERSGVVCRGYSGRIPTTALEATDWKRVQPNYAFQPTAPLRGAAAERGR